MQPIYRNLDDTKHATRIVISAYVFEYNTSTTRLPSCLGAILHVFWSGQIVNRCILLFVTAVCQRLLTAHKISHVQTCSPICSAVLHCLFRCVVNIVNQCQDTIWPVFYNATLLQQDSWQLRPGELVSIPYQRLIAGRIWARSKCQFKAPCPNDLSIPHACIKCEVGDCPLGHDRYARGENGTRCGDVGGIPPFDIFELTSGGQQSNDFYDLSRVDGSVGNVLVRVQNHSAPSPIDPKFSCGSPSCPQQGKELCPEELQYFSADGSYLGCASICTAVNNAQMRQHSEILQKIYQGVTTETRNPDGSVRTKGGLPMKDLVCCACGDGRGGCEVDPNSHFCCSPYVQHRPNWGGRCYHEDWPKPNSSFVQRIEQNPALMQRFNVLGLDINYASIFKVGCPDAYS